MFNLYRYPNLDDLVFEGLLTSMAALQDEDMRASFVFVCDLNDYHQEWLGSTATVSGFDQLVVRPTHPHGEEFDILKADVPDQDIFAKSKAATQDDSWS